jgi:small subunit ribosomal protein S11
MGKKKVAGNKADEVKKDGASGGAAPVAEAKKSNRKIDSGRVYISASYNNTIISVTDEKGNVVAGASAGALGFSGPKKATPFAASKVVSALFERISKSGPFNVDVFVSGVGFGRDSAVRSLANQGFNILSIKDATPIPHNGPKPPKVRRI